jgi:hypothetical protein
MTTMKTSGDDDGINLFVKIFTLKCVSWILFERLCAFSFHGKTWRQL